MAALARARVHEHRGAALRARLAPGSPIRAADVVAAIDGEAARDAVHPVEHAFGIAVRLPPSGGLAVEGAGEHAFRARNAARRGCLEHGGVEPAMDEEIVAVAEPGRRV